MLKYINPKYCNQNKIELTTESSHTHLLLSEKELVFLKNQGVILYDKYEKHPKQIFKYDTNYLDFKLENNRFHLENFYFIKKDNQTICRTESLIANQKNKAKINMTREEIEEYLHEKNYDAIYLIDKEIKILHAYDKEEGALIDKKIVPTDKKILKLWNGTLTKKEKIIAKNLKGYLENIDNVKNLSIYEKDPYDSYYTLLITVKDQKIEANWLGLDYISKDNFELTLVDIPIKDNVQEKIEEEIQNFGVHSTIKEDNLNTKIPYIKTK